MPIPRLVHQIWWQGEPRGRVAEFCARTRAYAAARNFLYILWSERTLEEALALQGDTCFLRLGNLHQRVDYCKVLLLHDYGGVCLDADSFLIGDLERAIDLKSDLWYIGTLDPLRVRLTPSAGGKYRDVNNAFLAAPPRHLAVGKYLAHLRTLASPCRPFDVACLQRTTGPDVLRRFLQENEPSLSDLRFLKPEVTEPCTRGVCRATPRTICIHEGHLTWVLPHGAGMRLACFRAAWCWLIVGVAVAALLALLHGA